MRVAHNSKTNELWLTNNNADIVFGAEDFVSDYGRVRKGGGFLDKGGQVHNIQAYGAVPVGGNLGTGGADSTTAIQAAMTAAGKGGVVYFPPCGVDSGGNPLYYKVSSTLNWDQGHALVGGGVDFSNLVWFGAAGGTMIQRSGGNSQGQIRGLTIGGRGILSYDQNIASWPATIINFANPGQPVVDYGLRLWEIHTGYCSGDAWSIPNGWWNFWAHHIRWDGVGGYWVNATAQSTLNLSTFLIDTFTCDQVPADPSNWGFRFDMSASTGQAGLIQIQGARIEATGPAALSANQGIVTLKSNTGIAQQWGLVMRDLVIDKGAGVTGTYSLINHIGNANGLNLSLMLENIRHGFVPASNLIIGNVPASLTQPPLVAELTRYVYQQNASIEANGLTVSGALTHQASGATAATAGFMGATPVAQQAVGGAAGDAGSTQTLANNLRTALVNLGLCKT